jgi:hypothetical protein
VKKKLLIFAETIDIDASSAGKANAGFIHSLVTTGFDVSVLHYSHKEITLPSIQPLLITESKTDINYWLSRVQRVLQRISGKNFSKSLENRFGFSFTFKNDTNSMAHAIKSVKNDFDLLITLSKGASYRTHAAALKCPKLHHKWLAYMHDPYPFHLYPPPYNWTEAGHRQKEAFFKAVSEKAAFSGFPSLLLQEWMGQYFPKFLKTGIILPHQDISEAKNEAQIPSYFDPAKFSLLHAGNMLGYRNPFHLIEAYSIFLEREPAAKADAQLIFLGPAEYHEPAFTQACKAVSSIYKSEGYVAFNEVYYLQQQTSVNVIIEAEAALSPFLPGKFPHCIKANKPILLLSPAKSECNRLLGEAYPYSALSSDISTIAEMLSTLYHRWKENNNSLRLDREDLNTYFTSQYIRQELMEKVFSL